MRKTVQRITRVVLVALALILAPVLALFVYLAATEYRPDPVEETDFSGTATKIADNVTTFSCMSWNIGYAGLGQEMDFFYEGGRKVRPPKEDADRYLTGIRQQVAISEACDFILLQEVDRLARRSYRQDQVPVFSDALKEHGFSFATNYRSAFIPLPVYEPMGKVESGIVTFSRYLPDKALRHAYTSQFYWPYRLGLLKRCFLEFRFDLELGKQLVLLNIHNSTYDKNGHVRTGELKQLSEFAEREYRQGNYVVIGGDWNMNPRGFEASAMDVAEKVHSVTPGFPEEILDGWLFAYDMTVPTNRDVNMPYVKRVTGTTLIDFFVLSPNIELLTVEATNLDFVCSDHNPVYIRFCLRKDVK